MPLSDREYLQVNQSLFSIVNAYHSRLHSEQPPASGSLTVSERGVILVLGQLAPINQRRLAEVMQVSPGPVSQYVHRLVIRKLVAAEQDQADRRNWWLRLTPAGESAYNETVQGAISYTRDFLGPLDESEQQALCRLLLKVSRDLGYDW